MQNQPQKAGPVGSGPSFSSLAVLTQPRVVLPAVGLLGLAIDLFVRPLSWVGLGLIALVAMPWLFQAWSDQFRLSTPASRAPASPPDPVTESPAKPRVQPRAAGREGPPRPEQRAAPAAQRAATPPPVQAPLPMREPPRSKSSAESPARPMPAPLPSK